MKFIDSDNMQDKEFIAKLSLLKASLQSSPNINEQRLDKEKGKNYFGSYR
jgi:hypothetical protein